MNPRDGGKNGESQLSPQRPEGCVAQKVAVTLFAPPFVRFFLRPKLWKPPNRKHASLRVLQRYTAAVVVATGGSPVACLSQ